MTLLRAFDSNFAKRQLREHLCFVRKELVEGANIPHSFETEPLLECSLKMATRRGVRRHPYVFHTLLSQAGIAHGLCGDDATSRDLFDRGLRTSTNNQERAHFHYLRGYYHFHRRGETAQAKEDLSEAYELSERSRRLRTQILLALGTVNFDMGCLDGAAEYFKAAHGLHLRDLEPHALLRLGVVRMKQSNYDLAKALNRKSHRLFKRFRNWRGMLAADSNLAVLYLDQGDAASAAQLLEPLVAVRRKLLDLSQLGQACNNLAVACKRTGRPATARDALLEAIRYHTALGRKRLLSGNYRNLGQCLVEIGEVEAGIAALDHALGLAREIGAKDQEFKALTDLLTACVHQNDCHDGIPSFLHRCYEILETVPNELPKDAVVDFSRASGQVLARPEIPLLRKGRDVREPRRVSSKAGREALRALAPSASDCDFDAMLTNKLGKGIPGRLVPRVDYLHRFLMMFTGDFFKSAHYTGEFNTTQERAKRHFRWLCGEKIIERSGVRKSSRYALAFHRN